MVQLPNHQQSEQVEYLYSVRHLDSVVKKRITPRWKMTASDAAKRFAGQGHELGQNSKEKRIVGGDYLRNSTAWFYVGYSGTGIPPDQSDQ